MSKIQEVSLFVRETMARIAGDDAKAIGLANQRKAVIMCKAQIANLNYAIITAEDKVSEKHERLKDAKFPTSKIEDGNQYIKNVWSKKADYDTSLDELDSLKDDLKKYEELLTEFS